MSNRTRLLAAFLATAGLLLAGCGQPKPEVTFFGNRTSVTTEPARFCVVNEAVKTLDCTEQSTATPTADGTGSTAQALAHASLTLRPGDPVEISVPVEISAGPWLVQYRYLDGSRVVRDGQPQPFTGASATILRPPTKADAITQVIVSTLVVTANGLQPVSLWMLVATPPSPKS